MRALREDERDEIQAVSYLIKHVLIKADVEGSMIWRAILELEKIGKKYVLNDTCTEDELSELLELDDMKDLVRKLYSKIEHYAKTGEIK